jgi:hypothetical protein
MPRNDPKPTWQPVSFLQLVAKIQGGTAFSVDQLVAMLDAADKSQEDFRINHQGVNFVVPLDQIREYFATHPRPTRKLTIQEEVESLRSRVKELEARLAEAGLLEAEPAFQEQPKFEKRGKIPQATPPEPRIDIPADLGDGKKQSIEEIQADLLSDLRGKKPVTKGDKVVKQAESPARPTSP